ncbi:MAG: hypothetical protein OXI65_02420 [Acidobacteriota bacterium]|nr:hypothetical protein [Acidobacteriota bacterium]
MFDRESREVRFWRQRRNSCGSPEQVSQDIQAIWPGQQDVDLRLGEPLPAAV